jgi:hypothetical protein
LPETARSGKDRVRLPQKKGQAEFATTTLTIAWSPAMKQKYNNLKSEIKKN